MHKEKLTPWALLILRLITGAILINHGWPKLFGDKAMMLGFFGKVFPFAPSFMLSLTGGIEVVGGILLILGLFTRYITIVYIIEFLYIVIAVKTSFSSREIDLMMLASAVTLHALTSGSFSLDAWMKMKKAGAPASSTPSAPMQS